jgi:hypothetical protein
MVVYFVSALRIRHAVLRGGLNVKKVLSAFLLIVAVFMAYAFSAVCMNADQKAPLGEKLGAPFKSISGAGAAFLALGAVALLGGLFFMFSKSRSEKAASIPSSELAARYALGKGKSKGLEVGFLFSGLLALGVLAAMVFGSLNNWFDEAVLGALGFVFALQIVMGVLFVIIFLKKKNKAVVPFIPAILLFLLEVGVGVFGFLKGPK